MSQSSHKVCPQARAEGGCPPVFMVDTYTTRPPPLPPRPGRARRHTGAAQTLLFMLVSLALCGLAIEGYFIYYLYQSENVNSATFSKETADEDVSTEAKRPFNDLLLSKPAAHLTGGSDVHHDQHVMGWSLLAQPLLHEIDYIDQSLVIQKEGFYFVYSKVCFIDNGVFWHSVEYHSNRYAEGNFTLLLSRNYSPNGNKSSRKNSFLGGVFHLEKSDALFVKVTNTRTLEFYKAFDNVFGAFML